MTKRDSGKFERRERDYYVTPEEATLKLGPHLHNIQTFAEPMCGEGAIIRALEKGRSMESFLSPRLKCVHASDISPDRSLVPDAVEMDVLKTTSETFKSADVVISNPPWPLPLRLAKGHGLGYPTLEIIEHLSGILPTWLLLSADFCHNNYFRYLGSSCRKIVSVGRVKWIAGSKSVGFDNAAWYLFDIPWPVSFPTFYPNAGIRMGRNVY